MVRKKTAKKKKPAGRRKPSQPPGKKTPGSRKPVQIPQALKAAGGLILLVLIVVSAGLLIHFLLPPRHTPSSAAHKMETNGQPAAKPVFEIYPQEDPVPALPPAKPLPPLPDDKPAVAIIIDDLGYSKRLAEKFFSLNAVLTFSILPNSPYHRKIAVEAHDRGFETMLHLPMEPSEFPRVDPGHGALLTSMSPNTLISQLNRHLDAIPYIKGVNNHMGSKMTASSTQMYQIFSILKKRNLFFIDSRTAYNSLCRPSARLLRIPFAERDVFLDNIQDPDAIRRQLNMLVNIAENRGRAVGIGHPYEVTYNVLNDVLPELKKKIKLVPASEIVAIADP